MPEKILDFGLTRLSTEGIFAVLFVSLLVAVLIGIVFVAIWATGLITSSTKDLTATLNGINLSLVELSKGSKEVDEMSKITFQTSETVKSIEKNLGNLYARVEAISIYVQKP